MNIKRTIQATLWRAVLAAGLGVLAIVGWMFHVQSTQAALDVPQILVYQGRLTDDDRITVDDGTVSMKFAIYDASSGGNCLWSAADTDATDTTINCSSNTPDGEISVTVTDGIFTVLLGDTTASMNALPDTLFDDNATLFLGVTIESDSEMTPRRRIGSAAYALQAGDADLLDSLDTDNDGCTTACVPVTDSNGNLVLTGDPQSTAVSGATLYVNPAAPTANEILFGAANNGTEAFVIDAEGDVGIAGHLTIADAANSSAVALRIAETYSTATSGTHWAILNDTTISGDLNSDVVYGSEQAITLTDTGATDRVFSVSTYAADDSHAGDGTTPTWRLFDGTLAVSNGTVTNAYGIDAGLVTGGGTITDARAVRGEVEHSSGTITTGYGGYFDTTGTIGTSYGVYGEGGATATTNYGGYFKADNGTTDYAIYTAEGRVHLEGDGTATSPTTATSDGSLFALGVIETDTGVAIDGANQYSAGRNKEAALRTDLSYSGTHANEDDTASYTTIASTGTGSGGTYEFYADYNEVTYNGAGTDTTVIGTRNDVNVDGNVSTGSYGFFTNVSTGSSASGVTNYGLFAKAGNDSASSTTTAAYGVWGETFETAGTLTTGYGGYFKSSGAAANYAIYTAGGLVQIEDDGTATTPNTATADGELFVVGDIENDGDIDSNGHLALIGTTPSTTSIIAATETFSAASEHRGLDLDLTVTSAQTHTGVRSNVGVAGALNSGGRVNGVTSIVDVDADAGSANDSQEINQFLGSTNYLGTGLTDDVNGVKTVTKFSSSGDATNAYGVQAHVLTEDAGAAITDAYGGFFNVTETAGTITKGYGVYAKSSGAGTNYAVYTDAGQVWIEGDGTPTTAQFNDVATGTTGTVFIQGDTEIYDGSLCVGDGATDDCSDAAGTDGVIYSVNTSVTQHDLAEMFPSTQFLTAGEIVSVSADSNEFVERTVGDQIIIGAISTAPGVTLGWETEADNNYPVALTGRAPVKVNGEGGAIAIGDRVALSSVDGVGKKATEASEVVGIAMQAFDGVGNGAVVTFIQPHYWNGVDEASIAEEEPEPEVDPSSVLAIEGNTMANIATLSGYDWSVDMNGVFTTEGAYQVMIRGNDNRDTVTYSTLSTREFITLAGTTKIEGRKADIEFRRVDPAFANVIQPGAPIVVTATMSNGSGAVSIREKSTNGFEIWRDGGTGDEVDWIVMAYRLGTPDDVYDEPEVDEEPTEVDTSVDESVEEVVVEEEPTETEEEETPVEENESTETEEPVDDSEQETEAEPVVDDESSVEEEIVEEEPPVEETVEEEVTESEEEAAPEVEASGEEVTEPEPAPEPEVEEVVEE